MAYQILRDPKGENLSPGDLIQLNLSDFLKATYLLQAQNSEINETIIKIVK